MKKKQQGKRNCDQLNEPGEGGGLSTIKGDVGEEVLKENRKGN